MTTEPTESAVTSEPTEAEVARERAELAETVEALAGKLDVKKRARRGIRAWTSSVLARLRRQR